ncbi:hypothetical protein HHI36_005367 [Cryptolaemus montrouzieri]|uniref:Uncharacterized protein n=1 Tax=Cryptolaemus montrouzieri TaxID=559131 RepID=A0ABD2NUF4_9CUCU
MDTKVLIMCFSENRLTENIEKEETNIHGYTCLRCDSESRRTCGVMIYVKQYLVDIMKTKNYHELPELPEYWKNEINSVKLWKMLKEIINKEAKNDITEIDFDRVVINDKALMARKLNDFYINSLKLLIDDIPKNIPTPSFHTSQMKCLDGFNTVTWSKLEEIVDKMKKTNSTDNR